MARKRKFTDVEGRAVLSQDSVAAQMVALQVEAKQTFNPDTKAYEDKKTADGVPQWTVLTLFQPRRDDDQHQPEVVPVTVTSSTMPEIYLNRPVLFENFSSWTYAQRDEKTGRILGVARSFSADGVVNGGEQ